jgi:hypothetical protein
MLSSLVSIALLGQTALSHPTSLSTSATTIGKIRGVRDPIYHMYLQSHVDTPVLGPEASADEVRLPCYFVSLRLRTSRSTSRRRSILRDTFLTNLSSLILVARFNRVLRLCILIFRMRVRRISR